ncbi:MAG: carbohydrate ABC transporter permease [Rectinemataceae bacterium]
MRLRSPSLSARRSEAISGYLFILPAALVLGVFGLFPLFFNIYISLFNWRIRHSTFVGLGNYGEIFGGFPPFLILVASVALIAGGFVLAAGKRRAWIRLPGLALLLGGLGGLIFDLPRINVLGDPDMMRSFRVTVWYSLGTVPVQLFLGFLIAVALQGKFKGRQVFRVIYLLPFIVPAVATASVFERLFSLSPDSWANQVLALVGMHPLQWLREYKGIFELLLGWAPASGAGGVPEYWSTWAAGPSLSLFSIMFFNYWVYVGYYALIYANALAAVPRRLYEAAALDGAGFLTMLRRITLPLVSPSTYFLSILGIIGTFKSFNSIYILRDPSTGGAADPMSVYIFFQFFHDGRFGYAAALSVVLFAIVAGLTVTQRRSMEKRVFFD